jgi:hypothetical protein
MGLVKSVKRQFKGLSFAFALYLLLELFLQASLPSVQAVKTGENNSALPMASAPATPQTPAPRLKYGRQPLIFETYLNPAATQVKYLARGDGYNIFFSPTEMVLDLRKAKNGGKPECSPDGGTAPAPANPKTLVKCPLESGKPKRGKPEQAVAIRTSFVGANPNATLEASNEVATKINFLQANDSTKWQKN